MEHTFPEKYKIITGVQAGTTCTNGTTGDWVNCKNFHRIYAICSLSVLTASVVTFNWIRGTNSAAGEVIAHTTGSKWWSDVNHSGVTGAHNVIDRLTQRTTSNSSYTLGSSSGYYTVVSMLDCASLPTSHNWVAFEHHAQAQAANFISMTYIAEKRYPQSVDLIATTSST